MLISTHSIFFEHFLATSFKKFYSSLFCWLIGLLRFKSPFPLTLIIFCFAIWIWETKSKLLLVVNTLLLKLMWAQLVAISTAFLTLHFIWVINFKLVLFPCIHRQSFMSTFYLNQRFIDLFPLFISKTIHKFYIEFVKTLFNGLYLFEKN